MRTTPGTDGTLGYNYIAKDDDVWVYDGRHFGHGGQLHRGLRADQPAHGRVALLLGVGRDRGLGDAVAEGQVQNLRYRARSRC